MSTVKEILNAVKDLPPEQQAELKRRLELLTALQDNGEVQLEGRTQGHVQEPPRAYSPSNVRGRVG